MAPVIISSLVKTLIEKSWELAKEEYLFDSKEEIHSLYQTLMGARAFIEKAEKNNDLWVKQFAYDAEDILDSYDYELLYRRKGESDKKMNELTDKFCNFVSPSHSRLVYHKKLKTKLSTALGDFKEIATLNIQLQVHSGVSSFIFDKRTPSDSILYQSVLIDREANVREILDHLMHKYEKWASPHTTVLPIMGIGGVGKTTLAKMVYNHSILKSYFELFIWVSVGPNFSPAQIMKTMMDHVIGTVQNSVGMDIDMLKNNLKKLIGHKKYLLVLDDVWRKDIKQILKELEFLQTLGTQGSAVMTTTRSAFVAEKIATNNTHMLEELSDLDCWELLKQKVFRNKEYIPQVMESLGRELGKKCVGLPLAAESLAAHMSMKISRDSWENILNTDMRCLELEREDEIEREDGILASLRVTYFYLPSIIKQCFAFCAMFPKGERIDRDMLIHLWMANGFLPSDPDTVPEIEGHNVWERLKEEFFFKDIQMVERNGRSILTFLLQDHVLELAKSIMATECCSSNIEKWEEIASKRFRHLVISCKGGANTSKGSSSKKRKKKESSLKTVRTLILRRYDYHPLPSISWSDLKRLRALSLKNTGISDLPVEICKIKHLRYLDLSSNDFLKKLPEEMGLLLNLQILDLTDCFLLHKVPVSLGSIKSLVHVYIIGCTSLRYIPEGMGKPGLLIHDSLDY